MTTRVVGFHKTPALASYFAELDIDWRFLGLTNNTLHSYRLIPVAEDCQNHWTNPKRVTSGSVRNDKPCLVSSLTMPTSQSDTYFSVHDGYNPIFYSAASELKPGQFKGTTAVEWRRTPGKHLFPSRIKTTAMMGDKVESEETITVLVADFDTPIDPTVFTLAGLNLNDGQRIAYPDVPAEDQPVWRNGKPVRL